MSAYPYTFNFSKPRNATPTRHASSYKKPYLPETSLSKTASPGDYERKYRDRLPSKSSHNDTFNTGLDETFEQSFQEEMSRQNLLIPDFHKLGDVLKTPTKESGLQLSGRSTTRNGTGHKSPREERTDRSPDIQEIKRLTFLDESPAGFDKKLFMAAEKQPANFERLTELGFEFGQIDREEKITRELLKVGKGLLDISQLVKDSLATLRSSKREDVERIIPSINSRIDCGRDRIGDYKKRLSNNFKVCLD